MCLSFWVKLILLGNIFSTVQNKRTVNCISIEIEEQAKNFFLSKNVHFCKVAHVPKNFPRKNSPKSLTVTYSQTFPKFALINVFFQIQFLFNWSFRSLHCCNKKLMDFSQNFSAVKCRVSSRF